MKTRPEIIHETKGLKEKSILMRIGKGLVTTLLIVYGLFLVHGAYRIAILKRINYFMPKRYDSLLEINEGKASFDKIQVDEAEYYFRLVAQYFHRADAFNMLGFTRYYLGDRKSAIKYYEKALAFDSDFFWTNYNLGILYDQDRQYKKAEVVLKRAISLDPKVTLKKILTSKIYRDILGGSLNNPQSLVGRTKRGYQKAAKLLEALAKGTENFQKAVEESGKIFIRFY